MNNMLHFWSPFLKIKRRAAEIFSTILVLDTNSLQIFFETNERRGDCATEKSQNLPLKVLLFKFKSHPHGVFGVGIQIGCITWLRRWDLEPLCAPIFAEIAFASCAHAVKLQAIWEALHRDFRDEKIKQMLMHLLYFLVAKVGFERPCRKYSRFVRSTSLASKLLIFALVALPLSATGGGRAPSPRPPGYELICDYAT